METNKKAKENFHAVDYMRQVRNELTEQFLKDKERYLEFLQKALEEFKLRQKKVYE
jgi:hypothetical protein